MFLYDNIYTMVIGIILMLIGFFLSYNFVENGEGIGYIIISVVIVVLGIIIFLIDENEYTLNVWRHKE